MYFLGKRLLTEPEGAQTQENSRHLIEKHLNFKTVQPIEKQKKKRNDFKTEI